MGLFRESDLRAGADRGTPLQKSAGRILREKSEASARVEAFDIFLSHSLNDQKLILGIWLSLEDMGYKEIEWPVPDWNCHPNVCTTVRVNDVSWLN